MLDIMNKLLIAQKMSLSMSTSGYQFISTVQWAEFGVADDDKFFV